MKKIKHLLIIQHILINSSFSQNSSFIVNLPFVETYRRSKVRFSIVQHKVIVVIIIIIILIIIAIKCKSVDNGGDLIQVTCINGQNQQPLMNSQPSLLLWAYLHSAHLITANPRCLSTNSVLCPRWHHWAGELEGPPLDVWSIAQWYGGLKMT